MDKQKEKEEMARIIAFELCSEGKRHKFLYGNKSECYSNNNFADCKQIKSVVDKLYNADYGKIDKDSVILSKEEYEKLTEPRVFIPKGISNKEFEKYGIIYIAESSIEIIPTRAVIEKETAEKILQIIKEEYGYIGNLEKIIAKQFGVEIKE